MQYKILTASMLILLPACGSKSDGTAQQVTPASGAQQQTSLPSSDDQKASPTVQTVATQQAQPSVIGSVLGDPSIVSKAAETVKAPPSDNEIKSDQVATVAADSSTKDMGQKSGDEKVNTMTGSTAPVRNLISTKICGTDQTAQVAKGLTPKLSLNVSLSKFDDGTIDFHFSYYDIEHSRNLSSYSSSIKYTGSENGKMLQYITAAMDQAASRAVFYSNEPYHYTVEFSFDFSRPLTVHEAMTDTSVGPVASLPYFTCYN